MKKTTILLALALASAGCEDPAADKPKAKVGPAISATAAASGEAAGATKPAAAKGTAFALDAGTSKLGFVGSKVTGKHDGGFKTFTATANLAEAGTVEGGSVQVEIDTKSIFSDADKLTGHLMNEDFFDVEKFPKASFASTEITKGGDGDHTHTVKGNLTLRGETKAITFPATITLEGETVTVKSEFAINRKDFGMAYPGKPDDLIRDDVVIKLDLKLNKKA